MNTVEDRMRAAAEAHGHDVVEDGYPGSRLTCTRCGRAVLCVGGPIYGSATTDDCVDYPGSDEPRLTGHPPDPDGPDGEVRTCRNCDAPTDRDYCSQSCREMDRWPGWADK